MAETCECSRNYIDLKEADKQNFLNNLKLGIYKELYYRELLTDAQLTFLLNAG